MDNNFLLWTAQWLLLSFRSAQDCWCTVCFRPGMMDGKLWCPSLSDWKDWRHTVHLSLLTITSSNQCDRQACALHVIQPTFCRNSISHKKKKHLKNCVLADSPITGSNSFTSNLAVNTQFKNTFVLTSGSCFS